MPDPEYSDLYQAALLWMATGVDAYGQVTVNPTPLEIRVRWNNTQSERTDRDGNTITLDATVVVSRIQPPIGSQMWLGDLETWLGTGTGSGTGSGNVGDELMQVKTIDAQKDLKARSTFVTVGLMRLRDTH